MSLAAALEQTNVYTVSQLNAAIKDLLETHYRYIWLKGEISNFRVPASGHFYFTLRDRKSQIKAVLFRGQQRNLKFRPEDGLQVICQGRISVYEPRGDYQILIDRMEPEGVGALQLAFEQLKKRLEVEGLFAPERKRRLPMIPQRLAIVTSATGAAIRDILKVLKRSPYPLTVTVIPVRVQGLEAAPEIAAAIDLANRLRPDYGWDLIIAGRGGGSLEDLWPFNEEIVARAIAASQVPVISAVGHEIDLTISDLAADLRVPTPTAAAEWVVNQLEAIQRTLATQTQQLAERMRRSLERYRQKARFLARRLRDPRRRLADKRLYVDDRLERLGLAMSRHLERLRSRHRHLGEKLLLQDPRKRIGLQQHAVRQLHKQLHSLVRQRLTTCGLRLQHLSSQLHNLSPLGVLARGYAIATRLPQQAVIRRYDQVHPGQPIRVQLFQGALDCTVDETHKNLPKPPRRRSPVGPEEEN